MSVFGVPQICRPVKCLLPGLTLLLMLCGVSRLSAVEDDPGLMIDRQPFDRIVLNAENDNTAIDVVLLDLPNRRVPDPLPRSGNLQLRRLSHPSILYTVAWSTIDRIELFEQLVLKEAISLTNAGESLKAFRALRFLHDNYAGMAGLAAASERYVKRDALDAFAAKRYEESLAVLLSLFDINPKHRGLTEAVQAVSDRVINAHLSARDFAAARSVLELLKQSFLGLKLQNVSTWESKFEKGAARQLQIARQAAAAGQFDKARVAVRRAEDILPSVAGALELMKEIDRLSPQIIVGVCQLAVPAGKTEDLRWSPTRAARLTDPPLIEMIGFGGEGGEYRSRWGVLSGDDSGLRLDLTLEAPSLRLGFSPERVALNLLALADPTQQQFQDDFASLFEKLTIQDGRQVSIYWRRPHVRPEALLRLSLVDLVDSEADQTAPGVYRAVAKAERKQDLTYLRQGESEDSFGPEIIIERTFENEEEAIAALQQGNISVLDRVAPWLVDPLRAHPRVTVASYRLPTVHVLQLNHAKPLLANREFRRALCYGIDRKRIVKDILLGGKERAGFRVLSGPLPAGVSITDPVGYGYNQQLSPRPYEPRLASVLATVARNTLAKRAADKAKPPEESEAEAEEKPEAVETPPLLLVYPPNSVARTCCQTIKLQLEAIGIPVVLEQLPADSLALPPEYDLLYAELTIREPLVDARRLLGPRGSAGSCSSSMSLALEQVGQARNWRQARERLRGVHQVAYYDLPVIPLWQTIDSFAYRKSLQGIGTRLVTLYQNIAEWQISYDGGIR